MRVYLVRDEFVSRSKVKNPVTCVTRKNKISNTKHVPEESYGSWIDKLIVLVLLKRTLSIINAHTFFYLLRQRTELQKDFSLVKEEQDSIHGHLENFKEALKNRSQEVKDIHTSIND